MANLKDVARVAGVTPTTVSRVLNERGYIGEATRRKVYAAMAELHYQPNSIARSLKRSRSDLYAILVPDSDNPFYADLIKEVETECRKIGKRLLLCNSFSDAKLERRYVQILNAQQIDGLILCSHTLELSEYEQLPFRVISFDRAVTGFSVVSSDNFTGGELAAKRLIESGCRRLLHISGPLGNASLIGHDRYRGFSSYCKKCGVFFDLFQLEDSMDFAYYRSFLADRLRAGLEKYDGAFCSNDVLAYALYLYAVKNGRRVPEDFKIIGFDYSSFAQVLATPKLTTVAQDVHAIAAALVAGLAESDKPVSARTVPVRLVEGDTV